MSIANIPKQDTVSVPPKLPSAYGAMAMKLVVLAFSFFILAMSALAGVDQPWQEHGGGGGSMPPLGIIGLVAGFGWGLYSSSDAKSIGGRLLAGWYGALTLGVVGLILSLVGAIVMK
jgi:hypothetical protein